jgi:hypothetical protein
VEPHELEKIKTALIEQNDPMVAASRPLVRADKHRATAQNDLAELETLLAAEPGLGRLTELLSRHRDARRDAQAEFEAQIRDEAKPDPAAEARAAAAISARAVSLELLSAPFTTSWVTLDTPFLIWQLPHPNPDIWLDSGIVPHASWVKALVKTRTGPGSADFRFYFLWENPSDYFAVANVWSSVIFNGYASARAKSGILSGYRAHLTVETYQNVKRWSGWGNDMTTNTPADQTAYPNQSAKTTPVSFSAYGGAWFDDATLPSKHFDPTWPYESVSRLITIPGHAVTVFEVGFTVTWSFTDGTAGSDPVEDDNQEVTLDLAYDPLGRIARCPGVQLEIFTQT